MLEKYETNTVDYDEGWAVFDCDGTLQILRLDDPQMARNYHPVEPLFESDEEAVAFVTMMANISPYHASALMLHNTATPGYPQ
jgi:hypothetical protein